MYIAVSGNIGCGKSSLVEMLSNHYGLKPYYENIDNPYLNDFYNDMREWSFKLQISFLANKIGQLRSIASESTGVVQDRTVYEEAIVFVKNLNNMALLSQRDYDTYLKLYHLLLQNVSEPQLLIYLKSDVPNLVRQIEKRGRDYEQNIKIEYLEKLNELYDNWITNQYGGAKLIIDIKGLDFVGKQADFDSVLKLIEEKIAQLGLTL